MRVSNILLIVGAVLAAPGVSLAGVYKADGCQVVTPDGWVASKSRIAAPDKKLWASLMQAGTAAEAIQVERNLGAVKVSETPGVMLMVSTASYGGLTNKQYHAISKTTPSCVADVTAPAGPQEATAKQIAGTVRLAK